MRCLEPRGTARRAGTTSCRRLSARSASCPVRDEGRHQLFRRLVIVRAFHCFRATALPLYGRSAQLWRCRRAAPIYPSLACERVSTAATTPSVSSHSRRSACRQGIAPGALADEDDCRLGPPCPGDVREPQALSEHVPGVDHDDVGGLAAGCVGGTRRRDARDDVDPLPVEQEPHELEVSLIAAREHDRCRDGRPPARLPAGR